MKRAKKLTDQYNAGEIKESSRLRRFVNIAVRIFFSIVVIYLLITKTNIEQIFHYLKNMSPGYVLLALLVLNFGQIISALRARYYFATEKIFFHKYFSIALYYVGFFFSRLLPGGVSGDAYVAYFLRKKKKISAKTSIRLLISSRASGLLFLMIFAFLLGFLSHLRDDMPHWYLLMVIGILGTIMSYTYLTRLLLREKVETQIGAVKYSVIVQGTVMMAAASLFLSTGMEPYNVIDYLMLFMISSIMILVPVSFGGAGMREITYFYGAGVIGLNPELGIAVSVVYFLLDTISSLAGVFFWHRIDHIPAFEKTKK